MNFYLKWAGSTLFGLFQQGKYCPVMDEAVNYYLDCYSDTARFGDYDYTLHLGPVEVWIAGEFYDYGYVYKVYGVSKRRPSLRTMKRVYDLTQKLKAQRAAKEQADYESQMERLTK